MSMRERRLSTLTTAMLVAGLFVLDQTAEPQLPARWLGRDVEMDEEVVQPGGRDIVAQRLKRHAAVAAGERELLAGVAADERRTACGHRADFIC